MVILTVLLTVGVLAACSGGNDKPKTKYTVTFDSDGGTPVISQRVKKNKLATEPQAPTKEGYEFDGWYLEDELWIFDENKVTSDITLKAGWTKLCDHDWEEVVTKDPTCSKEGEKTLTCALCTAQKTEVIQKLPHTELSEFQIEKEQHYQICVCGEKVNVEPHKFPEGTDETVDRSCTLCGYFQKNTDGIVFDTPFVTSTSAKFVVSNATESFSFFNYVTLVGQTSYIVSNDISGSDEIVTKTLSLNVGDNVVYVTEFVNGNVTGMYTVTIRRRPMYEVRFNSNGGSEVETQMVEESFCAEKPSDPTREHYIFDGWDHDFSKPITKALTVNASWTPVIYTVTFVSDGQTVEVKEFTVENLTVVAPEVPPKQCYTGKWENYTLGTANITVNAVYTVSHSNLMQIEAKASQCNLPGNIEYWSCSGCSKYFSNSDGTAEITDKSSVTLSTVACQAVSCECKWCAKPMHTLTHVTANVAKCNATGNIEYWSCSDCDKYFSNSNCTIEIVDKSSVSLQIVDCVYVDGNCKWCNGSKGLEYTLEGNGYSVTGIGNFKKTALVIPSTYKGLPVTSIGNRAFSSCSSLTSVTIPDSVTSIGDEAFAYCHSLTSVTIPNSVTTIRDGTFRSCALLTSVTVPDSVTSIGVWAFNNCHNLTSMTIPNSVTSIGYGAFSICYNLTIINYKGTEEQWNAITKDSSWDDATGNYTITYNYTGE